MSWHPANGLRSWLIQRLSAVYMAIFMVAVIIAVSICFPSSYNQWHGWIAHPIVNVATAAFFIALMFHTWVGMRDVIIDYVHPLALRLLLLVLLGSSLLLMGIWGIRILFSVMP
ncbi:MAG: succinate dehydrogenase, hydrophobic membrane anchor protein [Gammaproteobacteria bacterium]|nr:succinate dehydrogenase, hydrophobic membrane anchor protein [Gammaproteobacteria bacterium]